MANPEHLKIIREGLDNKNIEIWNQWRRDNPAIKPDLSSANFTKVELNNVNFRETNLTRSNLSWCLLACADLTKANLFNARLDGANLFQAFLDRADLRNASLTSGDLGLTTLCGADLSRANLFSSSFREAELMGANLTGANLGEANFVGTDLSWAILVDANLSKSTLVNTILRGANLNGCKINGISVWDLVIDEKTEQKGLIISKGEEPVITVDELEVAQFVYLLLNNTNVRNTIDTITSKVVLILGRFTDERKSVLDNIREELRKLNFVPILFDFNKPISKDVTGTVETLARMARFIIADLTDPSSIPHELATIVPHLRTTPIQLIKLKGAKGYSMIEDYYGSYKWLLEPYLYEDVKAFIAALPEIIKPANQMAETFRNRL